MCKYLEKYVGAKLRSISINKLTSLEFFLQALGGH